MASLASTSKVKVSVSVVLMSILSSASALILRRRERSGFRVPNTGMAISLRGQGSIGVRRVLERRHHFLREQPQGVEDLLLRHSLQRVQEEVDTVDAGGFPALEHFDDVLRIADRKAG